MRIGAEVQVKYFMPIHLNAGKFINASVLWC
jgi:hypothetical protein